MKSFHNDQAVKDKYVSRVEQHQLADEIVQGQYWEEGKGCAVGCTLHGENHGDYETELGIPTWIAKLQDRLFEGMTNEDAKLFPLKFLEAIPLGVDLDQVKAPFLIFVLKGTLDTFDNEKYPNAVKAVNTVIDLYASGCTDIEKFKEARRAASAAASAAASYAAASAASAAAAYAAASYAAAYAADAYAAYAADAAAAYATARQDKYKLYADKLLELFKGAK